MAKRDCRGSKSSSRWCARCYRRTRNAANTPRLLITTTYTHGAARTVEHLAASLAGEPNLLQFVVEDEVTTRRRSQICSRAASRLLFPLCTSRMARREGRNAQRNVALKYIRDKKLEGIVYNMDDDNAYHPKLWNVLRRVQPNRVACSPCAAVFLPRCDGRFFRMLREARARIERLLYEMRQANSGAVRPHGARSARGCLASTASGSFVLTWAASPSTLDCSGL